ncbi:RCC1-like G exchanging factor-like protein [Gigantopelta aegis]|uniref:RCC1-like G exchanging factor-like protein n=1 Tax=Gigantopelta aegis TaxID=1735272 RepID=UPI001B889097|nr:RCC1-like G exchanging factor-like protein [Gigantopelta aegis]XP_041361473.1 RCC1-like G exchanging factor-like protein [Gigantopelta aegis]
MASVISWCSSRYLIPKSVISVSVRRGETWKQRVLKREKIKEQVTEYIGVNAQRAERVYVWGCAVTGALGIKSYLKPEKNQIPKLKQSRPARLKFIDENDIKVKVAACGYGFTLYYARVPGGYKLFASGINTDSQLGFHEMPRKSGRILDYIIEPAVVNLPLQKPESTRIRHLACGRAHSLILTDEGVFSLGNNAYGQCGRPVVEEEVYGKNPTINKVSNLPDNISQVVCGQDHSLFISTTGELYSCGLGSDGQTGLQSYEIVSSPTRVKGDIDGEHIVSAAGKGDCVLAVSDKGDLFGWGNSEYNQLALVTDHAQENIPRHIPLKNCGKIIRAASGGSICAILNDAGEVYVWGYGILGKGPVVDASEAPQLIPKTLFGQSELQPDVKVKDIDCGIGHFAALTDHGDVFTWGKNREGCLGLGKPGDQFFPLKVSLPAEAHSVSCGVDHMIALCRSFS